MLVDSSGIVFGYDVRNNQGSFLYLCPSSVPIPTDSSGITHNKGRFFRYSHFGWKYNILLWLEHMSTKIFSFALLLYRLISGPFCEQLEKESQTK